VFIQEVNEYKEPDYKMFNVGYRVQKSLIVTEA